MSDHIKINHTEKSNETGGKPVFQGIVSPRVREGLIIAFLAYFLWGMMPFYLKQIESVPALEIVAHRIIWSVVFGAFLIGARKQWGDVKAAFSDPKILGVLAVAAIMISLNWLIYVWAVMEERVLEASLGYFINPLMYVAAGVVILKEKLRRLQIIALVIACIGVLILTIGNGALPWVAILLAILFTVYGYIRKTTNVGAMPGLFIETALLMPFALLYLAFLFIGGTAMFASHSLSLDFLLILAGPVTVMPLLLFALSAKKLTMTTMGLMQYIGPTMQFLFAIYYGEAFTLYHAIAFGMIWFALIIFTLDAVKTGYQKK